MFEFEQIKQWAEDGQAMAITRNDYDIDVTRGVKQLNEDGLKKFNIWLDIAKGVNNG